MQNTLNIATLQGKSLYPDLTGRFQFSTFSNLFHSRDCFLTYEIEYFCYHYGLLLEVIFQTERGKHGIKRIIYHVMLQHSDFLLMRMCTQCTDATKAVLTMLK